MEGAVSSAETGTGVYVGFKGVGWRESFGADGEETRTTTCKSAEEASGDEDGDPGIAECKGGVDPCWELYDGVIRSLVTGRYSQEKEVAYEVGIIS